MKKISNKLTNLKGEQGLKQSDLPEGQAFEKCLDDNLKKIDGFFISKKTELEERFQSLKKIVFFFFFFLFFFSFFFFFFFFFFFSFYFLMKLISLA